MTTGRTNLDQANALAHQLLMGSLFVGFHFGSHFTLFFDRQTSTDFRGKHLPWQVKVVILEEWWINKRKDWMDEVKLKGEGVEPDEPLKAFKLAALRWQEGATVDRVSVAEDEICIEFENKVTITAKVTGDDEYCLGIFDTESKEILPKWSVVCGKVGVRVNFPS